MKQYVHSFYTTRDFTEFTNSNNYHEPFVSDTFETNKVNYNLRKKLVFNILTNGYINWKCSDNSVSKRLYYIINDGQENYISSSTSGTRINVSSGDILTIWGDTFTCSESLSKYNTFEGTTCNFSIEGNLNALINTLTKTSLDNKDYIYANLFKNCTTLKSIQKIYLPVKNFGEGAFYQTFYGCTGIENNIFSLTIISCKERTFYQTFYNCSSLTNSNNFILNLSEVLTSCFEETFYGCSNLTTIPKINVINLGESSFKGLFKNCISLQEIDNIQINKISSSSFEEMFYGCTELSTINFDLNFGYVYDSSYKRMFYGCTSLQKSPNIGVLYIDEEVVEDPFYEMFYNCSSLNTIYISSYTGETENMFTSWVKNVSSTGVFYKNEDNSNWTIGVNGIPTGWISGEENYEELPLTFLFLQDGKFTINVNSIKGLNTLSYKLNSNEIKNINIEESQKIISVNSGDKLQLFGNSEFSNTTSTAQKFSSTSSCKMYGNLLSLSYSQTFYIHYLNNEPSILSFYYLFYSFTNLISAKNLIFPDSIDSQNNYSNMFRNCLSLQYSPKILPALNLNGVKYSAMFYLCSALLTIPLLPATILSESCYDSIFKGCSSLTSLPDNFNLPATTLTSNCYTGMFYNCSSLISLPANFTLSATTLAYSCYNAMFYECNSLTSLPTNFTLPATTLESNCYYQMFYKCNSLASLPTNFTLPATTLATNCYYYMFAYSGLTSLPTNFTLPATTLAGYCYENMFYSCNSLTSLPANFTLPATTLYNSCYYAMFSNTGLTSLPTNFTLPSTNLADRCYYYMFSNTRLTSLPTNFTLPATTLAYACYAGMFKECSNLTSLPTNFNLPATTLASECYYNMFGSCSNLTSLPEDFTLPATTLAYYCYNAMFYGCSNLTSLPANFTLPATTLATYCYYQMFDGCSKLILPTNFTLPATTLTTYCYYLMFHNCSKVNKIICLATTNINSSNTTTNWLQGASSTGIFYKDVNSSWPRNDSGIPASWTIYSYLDDSKNYILKGNNIFNVNKNFNTISNITIYYKNSYTYQIENSVSWISNIEDTINTNTGNDNFSSISMSFDINENNTGSDRSGSFLINFYNNSTLIDTLQIIVNQSNKEVECEIILLPSGSSYGWADSTLRGPNGEIIYSSSNNGRASSTAKMQIRFSGYNTFTIKAATNGESSCDYTIVSELDANPTNSSSIHGSTGNEWSGASYTSAKNSVSSYSTLNWFTIPYSNITAGTHIITILFVKDSSVDKYTDKGYIYIPS